MFGPLMGRLGVAGDGHGGVRYAGFWPAVSMTVSTASEWAIWARDEVVS
jgi:hypothetical protein